MDNIHANKDYFPLFHNLVNIGGDICVCVCVCWGGGGIQRQIFSQNKQIVEDTDTLSNDSAA